MNFRSFIALSEGSMEKSLLSAFLHQQGRPPAPIASATPVGNPKNESGTMK